MTILLKWHLTFMRIFDYRDPRVFFPYVKEQIKDKEMHYVLLDEVQLLKEFEAVLNSLSRMKNVDVYVTGSNAKFLSKDIITEFRFDPDIIYIPASNITVLL